MNVNTNVSVNDTTVAKPNTVSKKQVSEAEPKITQETKKDSFESSSKTKEKENTKKTAIKVVATLVGLATIAGLALTKVMHKKQFDIDEVNKLVNKVIEKNPNVKESLEKNPKLIKKLIDCKTTSGNKLLTSDEIVDVLSKFKYPGEEKGPFYLDFNADKILKVLKNQKNIDLASEYSNKAYGFYRVVGDM